VYDDRYDSMYRPAWPDPYDDRVRHLVLVDGRLIATWTEPAAGSQWESVARRFDNEKKCVHVPPPPPVREPFEEVLDWLDDLVGGRPALDGLTTEPLTMPPSPAGLEPDEAAAYDEVVALLDRVAETLFDEEVRAALHRALAICWAADPRAVLHPKSAAHAAGGLCWAVGRANGLFGRVSQKDVQRELWLRSNLSSVGGPVRHALRGLSARSPGRPSQCPDLVALGHADLVTAATRRTLLGWRDRAVAARDHHAASTAAASADAGAVPSEVGS